LSRPGQRLAWHAPEVPGWTYRPDDRPVEVQTTEHGVRFTTRDPRTELSRTIEVRLADGTATVDHTIGDDGSSASELAPWALTMLELGGEAWIPLAHEPSDPHGLLASASLVLWPYSHLDDGRLSLAHDLVLIRATPDAPGKLKIGASCVAAGSPTAWARCCSSSAPLTHGEPHIPT
jgi:hypothetical protein